MSTNQMTKHGQNHNSRISEKDYLSDLERDQHKVNKSKYA